MQGSVAFFVLMKSPRIRLIVVRQVAEELSELAEGKETIQLANIEHTRNARRILTELLEPRDPRWCRLL